MATKVANQLAAELAFKANVDAVSRDYVCEPHLGAWGERCRRLKCLYAPVWLHTAHVMTWLG